MLPDLIFLESVDANSVDGETPLEHLRASELIARERGFAALAVARSADGRIFTPEGFTDDALDITPNGDIAAARTIESSMWGLPIGADYVAQHWSSAAQEEEALLRLEDVRWPMLYATVSDAGSSIVTPRAVVGRVVDVRITPDRDRIVWQEWARGPGFEEANLIWSEDLAGTTRRLVTRLNSPMAMTGDLSISPDGRWLLAGQPSELVDLETGHSMQLGPSIWCACWYPQAGPSSILTATFTDLNEPADLAVIDLSIWKGEKVGVLPRRTNGLQAGADGRIAARVNAESEARAGGWFDELVVGDSPTAAFEPVLPLVAASGWRRRCTRPRWTAGLPVVGPVTLADSVESHLRSQPLSNGGPVGVEAFVVEQASTRIRHRLARIDEEPRMAQPLLLELGALLELTTSFDADLADAVVEDVLPNLDAVARRDSWPSSLLEHREAIRSRATGERPPSPSIVTTGGM